MNCNPDNIINIAFCFDSNMMRQACVSIASLLDYKNEDVHYHIYCICTEDALAIKKTLKRIVELRDDNSRITFHRNQLDLDGGYEIRGITVSTYFRLNLHRMFPHIGKIIYSDVDIVFQSDISEVWKLDIDDNYLAGVKADVNIKEVWNRHLKDDYWKRLEDWYGNYINAGFIIMNLEKMRNNKMEEDWNGMYNGNFFFQDQDILNITCKPYIMHLPMKYNRMMFYTDEELTLLKRYKVVGWGELDEALDHPIVIHYAGKKPWNSYCITGADIWWSYVGNNDDLRKLFFKELIKYKIISNVVKKYEKCLFS